MAAKNHRSARQLYSPKISRRERMKKGWRFIESFNSVTDFVTKIFVYIYALLSFVFPQLVKTNNNPPNTSPNEEKPDNPKNHPNKFDFGKDSLNQKKSLFGRESNPLRQPPTMK